MDNTEKVNIDFKSFIERLCRYYMEFLESDFKKRRNPSRKVVYRKKDILATVPLFKYEKLKKKIVDSINGSFKANNLTNITKGKFTIKLPEDIIEKINDDIEKVDYANFQVDEVMQKIEKHIGKNFPDREEFINELRFEIKNLTEESESQVTKEQIIELLADFICYDFYDELYELWKNKTILEGEELYLYFYDIEFAGNRYPIFFLPITLYKKKAQSREEISDIFDIEFGTQVLINKFAIEFISRSFKDLTKETRAPVNIPQRHLYLGDFDIRSEMQKMLNEVSSFFKVNNLNLNYVHSQKVSNEHIKITNNFYIAICDKSDESLLNDFEELMEMLIKGESSVLLDIFSKLSNDFILENPKVCNPQIDDGYYEKDLPDRLSYHSPIPLNEEQQKIIIALRHPDVKNIIVEGPPGTGKSHTITAIIFNALLEHKTVLMASDKKEALDVVEDKISSTLDKVKKEDEFLQNPLLRLGKKETNYSKIFKQQNFEKINSRYNAQRRLLQYLNKEIEGCTSVIKDNLNNQFEVYSSIDLDTIQEISRKENKVKDEYGKIIDLSEAYNNKEYIEFIKQIHNISVEFQNKKQAIDSIKNYIKYNILSKHEQEYIYKDIYSDIKKLITLLNNINEMPLDIIKENKQYLRELFENPHKFSSAQLEELVLLYDGIEEKFREYQSLFDRIFIDSPKVRNDIQNFENLLNEIREICSLLKKTTQFHKDNFRVNKSKLQLIVDINDKNVSEVEKYINNILNLKSKLFGIIFKRKELKKVNYNLLNNFPSWNVQYPHKRIRQLEIELRFYKIFWEVRKNLEKYSNINKSYFYWANLEKIVEHLSDFDFDIALENFNNVLPNFIQKLEAIKATSYFEKLPDNYSMHSMDAFKNLFTINQYINLYKNITGALAILRNRGVEIMRENLISIDSFLDEKKRTKLVKTTQEIEDVISFYITKADLLNKIKDLQYTFPNTIAKIGIDGNNPNTLVHNELCNFGDNKIQELCSYLSKYHSTKEKFDNLKISHYGRERSDLENKLVLKMTHILDSAVVNFRNENLNDQQQIRDLIRKKKRIPKELLRKLVEAFPCLIVNIRDLGEYLPLEPEIFDIVIIDEASQVSIAQSFPAILRGKKVIVFGDKKQYSNVKSHNASKEINNFLFSHVKESYNSYINNYHEEKRQILSDIIGMFDIKKSILDFLKRIANYSCSLRKHFRGYREIIGYSNKHFYNNYLQVMKVRGRPLDTVLHFHILSDVDKIDVYQNTNSYECDYIISKLEELKEKGIEQSVGIITPFTNQQRYIYGKILSHEDSDYFLEKMNLKVMTFDTCQGDEKDIVFYSFVERDDENILRYIFPKDLKNLDDEEEGTIKAQRLNVGLSRAREEMHFVLSKNTDAILGEIGRALRFYESELKETGTLPESSECQSEMEKLVLSYVTQTNFYEKHKENLEIHAQFKIGKYLRQLYDIDIPKYRTDFLLVFRDDEGKTHNVIIEYDGFEFHFEDQDNIGIENYNEFYIKQDIERQKTLESYGYDFIRLNRFIMGNDPIGFLDKLLSEISKKKLNRDHFIEKVLTDAEKIKNKEIKQCPKCGVFKHINSFFDTNNKSGVGRYCKSCKGAKRRQRYLDLSFKPREEPTLSQPSVLTSTGKTKQCTKCGRVKNIKEFRFRKTRNYYESICKECEREEKRKYKIKEYAAVEKSGEKILPKRSLIENAINNGSTLHMVYQSIHGKVSSRKIKPLHMDGRYLRAHCYLRGEERTFLVSRIKNLE